MYSSIIHYASLTNMLWQFESCQVIKDDLRQTIMADKYFSSSYFMFIPFNIWKNRLDYTRISSILFT